MRLRLHHIFFLHLAAIATFLFLAFLPASYYLIRQSELSSMRKSIEEKIILVERTMQDARPWEIARALRESGDLRVTLIDENGTVIIETHSDVEKMENHLNRPEVMEAATSPFGSAVRWSAEQQRDYLYVCRRIDTAIQGYLRVAKDLVLVDETIKRFWLTGAMLFGVAILLSLWATYHISRRVRLQVEELENYLGQLQAKNFRAPLKVGFAQEFVSIARKMLLLSRRLAKQEKTKTLYIARLKQKNRQITDIIDAISHEFKNPVAAIMGYCETLLSDKKIDEKIMSRFLEKIYLNSRTISEMIDRLSLSLKLENHTIELKTSAFEIEPLVQEVCSMLQQKYQGRVIIILGEGCSVVADRTLIYLVLVNLIDNALKYSKDEVYVSMSVEDRHCRVTVRDQGVGIEEREIKNITKKFYRVDRYSWDNSLGIGLSMVDYVLRLHGSVLSIKSTIGKGSEFSFTLELATPPTSLGATPEKS